MPRTPDKCLPVSPGIQKGAVEDLYMLPYNEDSSLKYIIERADQIACVFCESVQNRNPGVQPRDFLARLRQICTQYNIVLVFDEVVTGFRIGPGGAQQKLGIRADLACYGKALGGGFPVGLVAGFSDVMKGVDGGLWQYGDNSFPKATRTYFAGTFCKHPVIMKAVSAVLDHIIEHGDEFYPQLNANADYLCETINAYWYEKGYALAINHFGSQVRFMIPPDLSLAFFQTLMINGVYCWEGRTCFLTTCHTKEVIDEMLEALKKTTEQLVEAGASFPDLDAQARKK